MLVSSANQYSSNHQKTKGGATYDCWCRNTHTFEGVYVAASYTHTVIVGVCIATMYTCHHW